MTETLFVFLFVPRLNVSFLPGRGAYSPIFQRAQSPAEGALLAFLVGRTLLPAALSAAFLLQLSAPCFALALAASELRGQPLSQHCPLPRRYAGFHACFLVLWSCADFAPLGSTFLPGNCLVCSRCSSSFISCDLGLSV